MRADELHRLHEHARGAAAGVVHPAAVGLEHLDQQLDHAARRVELAAFLALCAGELREEVLVDAAEHVLGTAGLVADPDVADHVDQLAEALLVERGAGVVLGQYALQRRVVASMPAMASSTSRPMVLWRACAFKCGQRASGGTQKMLCARYSSGSSGSAPWAFRPAAQRASPRRRRRCTSGTAGPGRHACTRRRHAAAQGVGHLPELGFVADGGGRGGGIGFLVLRGRHVRVGDAIDRGNYAARRPISRIPVSAVCGRERERFQAGRFRGR